MRKKENLRQSENQTVQSERTGTEPDARSKRRSRCFEKVGLLTFSLCAVQFIRWCRCMPIKLTQVDVSSTPQKLSKIETLRLARNYISAMSQTLREGRSMDVSRFAKILCADLSQTTANLLTTAMLGYTKDTMETNLNNDVVMMGSHWCCPNHYYTNNRYGTSYEPFWNQSYYYSQDFSF